MATYVLELDEETQQGQAFREHLIKSADGQTIRVSTVDEYERAEEQVIAAGIRQADDSPALNYEEAKAEFARLRSRLKA